MLNGRRLSCFRHGFGGPSRLSRTSLAEASFCRRCRTEGSGLCLGTQCDCLVVTTDTFSPAIHSHAEAPGTAFRPEEGGMEPREPLRAWS